MREETEPNEDNNNVSFTAKKRPANYQRRKSNEGYDSSKRSESYLGRLRSFLGFNQSAIEPEESKSSLVRAKDVRRDVFSEAGL
eukprot:CAMPEP_0170456654 /NCGR_PEP_ID=MMETSP0123-20130129/4215_1 /TAXON_ID=182087 /ORGANISM="Favella ehrenbergii, Strain Fehren 1" /LENGTH=83 /DNA_ID=CAMNT_0010720201 /DNA_START=1105 /DNA_END=1359 /DNA_ORIENTATION=+